MEAKVLAAIVVLIVSNFITIVLFYRAKKLNSKMVNIHNNLELLEGWLEVQEKLKRVSGSLIRVQVVDETSILYREPKR